MALQHSTPATAVRQVEPRAPARVPEAADPALQPESVLSVLEADQLVAAKQATHFGPARLSRGARVLLWGLRLYVVAMLIMVGLQVLQVMQTHGGH